MVQVAALVAGAGHPAVAVLLGLAAVALAGLVVAMAWNVHARQIRLAEQLARRQYIVTAAPAVAEMNGHAKAVVGAPARAAAEPPRPDGIRAAEARAAEAGAAPALAIEGPDTVIIGDQARYSLRPSGTAKVVSWAVGGGSVSQSPDPVHPEELLLVADRPGDLTVIVRVREGMMERRATKPVTAVPDVTAPAPPFTLRLFLQGWGLVAVAVLVAGFAGALVALGSLAPADFIALVAPLAALLAVAAFGRGAGEAPRHPGQDRAAAGSGPRP